MKVKLLVVSASLCCMFLHGCISSNYHNNGGIIGTGLRSKADINATRSINTSGNTNNSNQNGGIIGTGDKYETGGNTHQRLRPSANTLEVKDKNQNHPISKPDLR